LPIFGTGVFLNANQSYIFYPGETTSVQGRPAFNPNDLVEVVTLEEQVTTLETAATSNATVIATLQTQTAVLQAEVALLEQRPTLEEVQDGRPGSVLLSVDSEAGSVTLNFTVEESEDLTSWTPVAGPGVSQTLTLPEGNRFYRFAH